MERGDIAHYCRDCKKMIAVEVMDEDLAKYRCTICQGENIATGTMVSLSEYFSKKR
jgi:hypothetical protein